MADNATQELKIHIVSDADVAGFKSSAEAARDLHKEMGVINVTQEDAARITDKATEKFAESKHEIREAGNELGRLAGISNGGKLALGGVAAAASAVAIAVEFLKSTWEETESTINGPIEIGLPDDAPKHISAAATAWEQYATARAKVIENSKGAEAAASAREKELANELKLIKEVLAAEKEKALADLELKKDQMTPAAYAASRANIGNIFDEAGTAAEQKNRNELTANKFNEAYALEIQAREKTQRALAIKAAPDEVAKNFQKTLDENAANGESAKKELKERIALIDRYQKYHQGGDVPEYEGVGGKLLMLAEAAKFNQRYGYADPNDPKPGMDAKAIEETRLAQAQAAIDSAENYRRRQTAGSTERERLMTEAGGDSGRAANLRAEAGRDREFNRDQNAVDARVAALHQSSAKQVAGASGQTVTAVEKFTAAVVGGFGDVHKQFTDHQNQLAALRAQIQTLARRK